MMHLLYRCSHASSDGTRKVLTEAELRSAGVHCEMDTWVALKAEREGYAARPTGMGPSWR